MVGERASEEAVGKMRWLVEWGGRERGEGRWRRLRRRHSELGGEVLEPCGVRERLMLESG